MSATMEHGPEWDEALADDLVGSIVLVGLTYTDAAGKITQKLECFGVVTKASREEGIAIECHGETWKGQTMTLPPTTAAFQRAAGGRYRLHSTGETVVDPDFTTTWTFQSPPE